MEALLQPVLNDDRIVYTDDPEVAVFAFATGVRVEEFYDDAWHPVTDWRADQVARGKWRWHCPPLYSDGLIAGWY